MRYLLTFNIDAHHEYFDDLGITERKNAPYFLLPTDDSRLSDEARRQRGQQLGQLIAQAPGNLILGYVEADVVTLGALLYAVGAAGKSITGIYYDKSYDAAGQTKDFQQAYCEYNEPTATYLNTLAQQFELRMKLYWNSNLTKYDLPLNYLLVSVPPRATSRSATTNHTAPATSPTQRFSITRIDEVHDTLVAILAEFFRYYGHHKAIPDLVAALQDSGNYQSRWPAIKKLISERKLKHPAVDCFVEEHSDYPLCGEGNKAGYAYLDLIVYNVEQLQEDPNFQPIEFQLIDQNFFPVMTEARLYQSGPMTSVDWVAGGNFDGYVYRYYLLFSGTAVTLTTKIIADRYDEDVPAPRRMTGQLDMSDRRHIRCTFPEGHLLLRELPLKDTDDENVLAGSLIYHGSAGSPAINLAFELYAVGEVALHAAG